MRIAWGWIGLALLVQVLAGCEGTETGNAIAQTELLSPVTTIRIPTTGGTTVEGTTVDVDNDSVADGVDLSGDAVPEWIYIPSDTSGSVGIDQDGNGIAEFFLIAGSPPMVRLNTVADESGENVAVVVNAMDTPIGVDLDGDAVSDDDTLTQINTDVISPMVIASPSGGMFDAPVNVLLVCSDDVACGAISYTLDGSDPDFAGNGTVTVGSSSITVVGDLASGLFTVKFLARDSAGNLSGIQSEIYDVNLAPVAVADLEVSVVQNSSGVIELTGVDGEDLVAELTVNVGMLPVNGSLDVNTGPAPLSVTYTPDMNYNDKDSLTFTVTDTDGNVSDPLVVTILIDSDFDRLSDADEVIYGSDAGDSDSDNDGILDGVEVIGGFDPTLVDTDGDGLSDGLEDLNHDGVRDPFELDPTDADSDDDGLSDGDEVAALTNPNDADSDGDGQCDGLRADNDGDVIDPPDPCIGAEGVLYVDVSNVSGTENGFTWATAFTKVQPAIDAAEYGDEVWVAAGTYTSGSNFPVAQMVPGGSLFGGFTGTETMRGARDWVANPSILNGDQTDDGPTLDDAASVIWGAGYTRISGFRVTGGNTEAGCPQFGPYCTTGAGMANLGAGLDEMFVDDVIFHDNHTDGATIYNFGATISFSNVLIVGNTGYSATAGMESASTTLDLDNVAFVHNMGDVTSVGGGLDVANQGSVVTASNVTFVRNEADYGGGVNIDSGLVTIVGATFSENTAIVGGGLRAGEITQPVDTDDTFLLANVTFRGNVAAESGGAILLDGSTNDFGEFVNVTFDSNQADADTGDMTDGVGGAVATIDGDYEISNAAFYGNLDQDDGGSPMTSELNIIGGTLLASYSCNETGIAGTGNVMLAGLPFEYATASPMSFLDPAGADTSCIDAGNPGIASAALGFGTWQAQTTRADGQTQSDIDGVNTETPDGGRHYDPFAVRIDSFSADGTNITWTGAYAGNCFLFNDANDAVAVIPEADLDGGMLAHAQAGGTELFLICMGNAGEPAVATAIVP
ncbi:MAG: chitobiase/beta-hexosaminidase C-terminal domain-containing protein [Chrysiogenetes bacterium]|nr:chitobiase/beta-hexosaminidase C-terminal domain-containing protein [Chrysiogenetes bacterium]